MAISLYRASVPVFLRALENLGRVLDKAVEHQTQNGADPELLVQARLAPDMYPLAGQIQAASDAAKSGSARLAGVAVPSFPDNETTIAQLRERIAKTVTFLNSIEPAAFEGADDRVIELKLRQRAVSFHAHDYLLNFVLPNFYFHTTTAYDIVRHLGVPVGKMDYLGSV